MRPAEHSSATRWKWQSPAPTPSPIEPPEDKILTVRAFVFAIAAWVASISMRSPFTGVTPRGNWSW
jgi:hypothetical protein